MNRNKMFSSIACSVLVAGIYGCGSGSGDGTGDGLAMSEMELADGTVAVDEKGKRSWRRDYKGKWDKTEPTPTEPTPTEPTPTEPTPTEPTPTEPTPTEPTPTEPTPTEPTPTEPTPTEPTPTEPTPTEPTPTPPPPTDSGSTTGFSVTSVANSGGTLTVSGAGFGTAKVAPLLWDDFEGGTAGASIASSPKVGSWNVVSAARTTYTTNYQHSGSKSLQGSRTPSGQWANFDVAIPDGRTFYQSFWFRYNYPAGGAGQAKLSQIHGTYGVGDYNPGVMTGGLSGDWWASYIALENSGTYNRVSYAAQPTQNAWHHFESVMKQSDPGVANGSVEIRIDGKTVYRQSPVKTRELSGQRWNLAAFFTGMTNFTSNTYTWIDDVYFSDSWARVEICETPTYASCTRKEIQPLKSWGSSAITATMNRGGFQPGQNVYLFVVRADGTATAGYPVVVQ